MSRPFVTTSGIAVLASSALAQTARTMNSPLSKGPAADNTESSATGANQSAGA